MLNYCAFLLLAALFATQTCGASEVPRRQPKAPPVVGRAARMRQQSSRRRSLPAARQVFVKTRETLSLNAEVLRTLPPDYDPARNPYAWRAVSRCLSALRRLGVEEQAAILCAGEADMETCEKEVKEWINTERVLVGNFTLIQAGYKRSFGDQTAWGPFNIILPEPHMLARLDRLGDMCVRSNTHQHHKETAVDYVAAALALIYYHPASVNAWCQHFGIAGARSFELRVQSKLPLWYQAAVSIYSMRTRPRGQGEASSNVFAAATPTLLRASYVAETTASSMELDELKSYLVELDHLMTLHGGPDKLSVQECAERLLYWVVKANNGLVNV